MQASFSNAKENIPPDMALGATILNKMTEINKNTNTVGISTKNSKTYVQKNSKRKSVVGVAQILNFVDPVKVTSSKLITNETNNFINNNTANKSDIYSSTRSAIISAGSQESVQNITNCEYTTASKHRMSRRSQCSGSQKLNLLDNSDHITLPLQKLFNLVNETNSNKSTDIKKRRKKQVEQFLNPVLNTTESSNEELTSPPLKKSVLNATFASEQDKYVHDIIISKRRKIRKTKSQEVNIPAGNAKIDSPQGTTINFSNGEINALTATKKRGRESKAKSSLSPALNIPHSYNAAAIETEHEGSEKVVDEVDKNNTISDRITDLTNTRRRSDRIKNNEKKVLNLTNNKDAVGTPTKETSNLTTKAQVLSPEFETRLKSRKINETKSQTITTTDISRKDAIKMSNETNNSETYSEIRKTRSRQTAAINNDEKLVNQEVNNKQITVNANNNIEQLQVNTTFQALDEKNKSSEKTVTSKSKAPMHRKLNKNKTEMLIASENCSTPPGQETTLVNTIKQQNLSGANKLPIPCMTVSEDNVTSGEQQETTTLVTVNQQNPATATIKQEVLSTLDNTNNEASQYQNSTNKIYEKNLKAVLSNLYLNIVNRLHLKFPLYCIENFSFCRENHYRKKCPEIGFSGIDLAFQEGCYKTVIWILWDVCKHNTFPGENNLVKIIDLILSLNPRNKETEYLIDVCAEFCEVFKYIVRTFPPCYIELREHYLKFVNLSIEKNVLAPETQPTLTKSNDIFNQLLDLLKLTMEHCSSDELSSEAYTYVLLDDVCEDSFTELNANWVYEPMEAKHQKFIALEPGLRLERIFMVLNLIIYILEHDLAMWLVHNFKTPSELMFCERNRALIVEVFKLQKCHYSTSTSAYFMDIFIDAVNKGLHQKRLEILERYLGLLMVACNSAEIETIDDAIKYPYVGSTTKHFIKYFFIKVKGARETNITTFLTIINLLQTPFLRYEFIDHFLSEYSPLYKSIPSSNQLILMKIYNSILKYIIWTQHQRKTQLSGSDLKKVLSSDDLLDLLLLLLKSYNEFHGLESFMEVLVTDQVECFATNNKQYESMEMYDLESVEKDINELVQNFDDAIPLTFNKLELSANIYVDEEIRSGYYNNMKYISHIQKQVNILLNSSLESFDTTGWTEYMQKFSQPT